MLNKRSAIVPLPFLSLLAGFPASRRFIFWHGYHNMLLATSIMIEIVIIPIILAILIIIVSMNLQHYQYNPLVSLLIMLASIIVNLTSFGTTVTVVRILTNGISMLPK